MQGTHLMPIASLLFKDIQGGSLFNYADSRLLCLNVFIALCPHVSISPGGAVMSPLVITLVIVDVLIHFVNKEKRDLSGLVS